MSDTITQATEDVTAAVNRRLSAIAAEPERAREEVSNLRPAQIPSVQGAVADVERAAASLGPRLEWIRWRSLAPRRGAPRRSGRGAS